MGIIVFPNSLGCYEDKHSINIRSILCVSDAIPGVGDTAVNKMGLAAALVKLKDQMTFKRSLQMG